MRTVGRWRSFATICEVTDSTSFRSLSGRRPSRPSALANSLLRISSARARSEAIAGTTVERGLPLPEALGLGRDELLGADRLDTTARE